MDSPESEAERRTEAESPDEAPPVPAASRERARPARSRSRRPPSAGRRDADEPGPGTGTERAAAHEPAFGTSAAGEPGPGTGTERAAAHEPAFGTSATGEPAPPLRESAFENGAGADETRQSEREEPPRARESGPRPSVYERAFPTDHLDEDALKVLRRLHRHGHKAYLVGGCVRDLLLGRRPKDFDVATSARPLEIKTLFRNCRIIGRRFRLAHILFAGGKVIETATFRRDPTANADEETYLALTDDAHEAGEVIDAGELDAPIVPRARARNDDADLLIRNDNVFGEPHEDALRRDFTINGLFYDVERAVVIDYVGGLRDLERRAIRTIGIPDVRFREDPVRILRAIKFSARLDFGIDPETYDAMVAHREELRKAAKPRLLEELLRLLRGGAAHRSIWLAWEIGVLTVMLPELAVFLDDDAPRSRRLWGRLDAIDSSVKNGRIPSDAVLLAALLLDPIEEALEGARDSGHAYEDFMRGVNNSLAVPRRMKERMRTLIGSQRRLRARHIGPLVRRDFFPEAVQLFELECAAHGQQLPALTTSMQAARGGAPEGEVLVRRRRRRRRRPEAL
jgi:poly(A) polymerase